MTEELTETEVLTEEEAEAIVNGTVNETNGTEPKRRNHYNRDELTIEKKGDQLKIVRERLVQKSTATSIGVRYETLGELRKLRDAIGLKTISMDALLQIMTAQIMGQLEAKGINEDLQKQIRDKVTEQVS